MYKKFIFKTFTQPVARLYWRIFKPKTYGSRGIILFENEILLVKNINVDHWSLPGGKIDKGESPEECLLRELKEELDLDNLKIAYKLGEYIATSEGKRDTVYIFVINLGSNDFKKQWELEDARFFGVNELPVNVSHAALQRINEYKTDKREIFGEW